MTQVTSHKRGKNIYFVKEGISGHDFKDGHGWSLYSLATILKKQNDTNVSGFFSILILICIVFDYIFVNLYTYFVREERL